MTVSVGFSCYCATFQTLMDISVRYRRKSPQSVFLRTSVSVRCRDRVASVLTVIRVW